MNDKIITALLAILIAISGWSLTTTVGLKSDVAVLKEKVTALTTLYKSIESQEGVDISGIGKNKTKTLVNEKEIQLLKVQIEEIKINTSNPLAN